MTELATKLIKMDGGTQARAGTDRNTIAEYIEALRESNGAWPFPAVTVYHDGDAYWLADGFHRITAARQHGRFVCEADIRQGTQRDAILHAAGANADHGLRRTPEDKRRAVLRLLEDAEWGRWSDREIARRCRVSPTFVGGVRKELGDTVHVDSERVYVRNGEERVMDTAAIGGKPRPSTDDMRKRLRQSLRDKMYATYQVTGITDADLRQVLSHDWGLGGGSSGPDSTPVYKKGGANPGFWYNNYRDSGKPTLSGRELIDLVREVLGLPHPQETAVSQPEHSPFYVGEDAQQPEIRPALDGYLRRTFSRAHLPKIIEVLINRAHPDSDFRLNQASQALGARPGHIRHAALVLKSSQGDYQAVETAVSHPTPEQTEGLVTRAANDVIDEWSSASKTVADIRQEIMGWYIGQRLNDIPGQFELMKEIQWQTDSHPLWADMVAQLPYDGGLVDLLTAIDHLVNYLQERVDEPTAVPQTAVPAPDLMSAIMADVDAYEADTAQLFTAVPAPRHADYTDTRLADLNTATGIVTRLTADSSLTIDIAGPLARALGLMEDAKKALTNRQAYAAWLRDYQDDDGRRWTDLTDTQTWHKNSPCYQAFVKAFPKEDFARSALMDAKQRLEQETAVSQEAAT